MADRRFASITLVCSSLILLTAGGLAFVTPVQRPDLVDKKLEAAAPATAYFKTNLAEYARLFDSTELPAAPEPFIDPLASLRAYRLIGVIDADSQTIALLSDGSETHRVTVGDKIREGAIAEVTPSSVIIKADETSLTLTLDR